MLSGCSFQAPKSKISPSPTSSPQQTITSLPATITLPVGQVARVVLEQQAGYSWKITYADRSSSRNPAFYDVSFTPPRTIASPSTEPGAPALSQSFVFARSAGTDVLDYTYLGPDGSDPVVKKLTINIPSQD